MGADMKEAEQGSPAGPTKEELAKLQRYIGKSTDELPTEQIVAHIEKVNDKTPLTEEDWEKLLIPVCGNQNTEALAYLLGRLGKVRDIQNYMKHSVMGQEKRKEYLLKRIEILKMLIPYIPENEKTAALSETMLDAAWYGETEVVGFLVESGADVHYKNELGKDVFQYAGEFAEKFGDDTLCQYLQSYEKGGKENRKGVFARLRGMFSQKK